MNAEIGFARDQLGAPTERLTLEVQGRSSTEHSMLQSFARRLGFSYDPCSGVMYIEEPVKPV